jgi:integrase/recombinase XerD
VEARWAHNPKVAGSNPAPATKENEADSIESAFSFALEKSYNNLAMESKVNGSNLKSVLAALQKLPQADRQRIIEALQSKPSSLLEKPADGYNDWQNELRLRGLASGTLALYGRTVRKLLERYPTPTARDVRAYLTERLGIVTPAKVRNDEKSLKSFFNFLEEQGLWLDNPVRGMRLMRVKKVIRQAPPAVDVNKLLQAWQGSSQRRRDRLLIALFVDTGVRISEGCSIKQENVDLDNFQIKVEGKGKKERIVPISHTVANQIQEYLEVEKPGGIYLFPAGNKTGYQGIRSLEKTFRRLCKRLQIKPITPHMLRHFFATYTLRNGAKLEVISRILGHASVGITGDTYRHVDQEEIQEEHKKFSPLADKETNPTP